MITCYLGPMDGAQVTEKMVGEDGLLTRGIQQHIVTVSDTVAKHSMRINVWEWAPAYEHGEYVCKYRLIHRPGLSTILRYVSLST